MMDQNQRMIDVQARKISELNDTIRYKNDEIMRLKDTMYKQHLAGKFYLEMQKAIIENPSLKSEWDNFCIILRMTCPEMDEIIEKVTKDHERQYNSSYLFNG